jgi:hypothetical protein
VDDAAIFPPRGLALGRALEEHREHLGEPYAPLLRAFVVSDGRLPELVELTAGSDVPLPVTVVVSGGAGSVEPAARWADGAASLDLVGLEVALRDPEDLPGNVRRVAAAGALGLDVPVYVEPPQPTEELAHGWLSALDEVAAADLRLKLRTGGTEPHLHPSPAALGAAIDAALDRELAFKCTAGLHHAVRHTDPATGVTEHGFLNVLLATRAALDGADVVAVLEERDGGALLRLAGGSGAEALARTRRWFTSFGCCDACDVLEDLLDLGVVEIAADPGGAPTY